MKKVCILIILLTLMTMTIHTDNYIEQLFLCWCLLVVYFLVTIIFQKVDSYLQNKKFEEEVKHILNEDFILRLIEIEV